MRYFMKKLLLVIAISFLAVFFPSAKNFIYAAQLPGKLRVGLESKHKEKASVVLSNPSITVALGDSSGSRAVGTITGGGFTITADNNYYVKAGSVYSDFNQANSARLSAESSGRKAAVAVLDINNYCLYYSASGEQDAKNTAASTGGQVVNPSSRRVSLTGGGTSLVFDSAVYFPHIYDSGMGFVSLSDRKYRGVVEFGRHSGRNITPVNILTTDEYLYSAVSSEMPSSWHIEALKAQTVACRNYTITRIGVHKDQGYDICDIGHCQNYLGAGNEAESTSRAVNETSGVLIYYDGEPINAVYFSSSGGQTDDSGNVWANTFPYMTSVKEISEYDPKIWNRTFTLDEINSILTKNNVNIGNALSVSIGSTNNNGRVAELIIKGTNGSKSLFKEDIRNFFAPSTQGALESRNFTLSNGSVRTAVNKLTVSNGSLSGEYELSGLYFQSSSGILNAVNGNIYTIGNGTSAGYSQTTTEVVSEGGQIVFSGRGWGHGVGMSQHGAQGMALMGYTYKSILEYYYTGVMVR